MRTFIEVSNVFSPSGLIGDTKQEPQGDSSELHRTCLLRTILSSLARAHKSVHIHNIYHRQPRRSVSEIKTEPNMYVKLQAKLTAKESKYLSNSSK